jgi:hypothetical protein
MTFMKMKYIYVYVNTLVKSNSGHPCDQQDLHSEHGTADALPLLGLGKARRWLLWRETVL